MFPHCKLLQCSVPNIQQAGLQIKISSSSVVFIGKTLDSHTVPLSTQEYKWVPANLMLGVTLGWTSIAFSDAAAWATGLTQTLLYTLDTCTTMVGLQQVFIFVAEQVMEYHLQAIDELSIPNDSDVEEGDHVDAIHPITSKYCKVFHFS